MNKDKKPGFLGVGCTGFTLVEVMVAAVVLALGLVIIFEVFLLSLDIVSLFDSRLNAQWFANEKIWQVQNMLDKRIGTFVPMHESGTVILANKQFNWQMNLSLLDADQELYSLITEVRWMQGPKQRKISRQSFVKRYFNNVDFQLSD